MSFIMTASEKGLLYLFFESICGEKSLCIFTIEADAWCLSTCVFGNESHEQTVNKKFRKRNENVINKGIVNFK